MRKKSYNWKGREVVDTVIDNTETNKIHLDLNVKGTYDQSNELVLPSKKRKTKIKNDKSKVTRILSKKQRKRLEKVVEKKKKKEGRAELLEALSQVQATPEELSGYTSIASIQTIGLKRYFADQQGGKKERVKSDGDERPFKINSIAGSKRKRISLAREAQRDDPNVIGFESSGSDSESSDESLKKVKVDEEPPEVEVVNGTNAQIEDQAGTVNGSEEMPVEEVKAVDRKPAIFVPVNRSAVVQKARLKLPILAEEQEIMEQINQNSFVVLAGETGSGKTTQVPQFLYEAGYALKKMIGITEPRRVAAISMSQRVAHEMNLTTDEVSYLIRFEGNVTDRTKIKFMTDGVLLKEIQGDFLLAKYSVIILDEAHERSVYTDILIGLLSRIVPLRQKRGDPLKLIIMSATLRLEDFTQNLRLFKVPPPVIKVETRQFPVTIHFNKRTFDNYLKEAYTKIVKIHNKLPDGGVLVFVTGQREVKTLVRKLRKAFPLKQSTGIEDHLKKTLRQAKKKKGVTPIDLDDYSVPGDNEESGDESDYDSDIGDGVVHTNKPLWVLPLFSQLPSGKQAQVFQPPPEGCRLCIVSTNVAETSLTIPNIKYVVDTGKTKVKLYDKVTGVTSYMVTWTSKASASQRSGRAGRIGPGHCYRLYSSAVYNDAFQEFAVPEIQQKPVDDLYLQMKCMNIDKVQNFPFPTAPDLMQLKTAQSRLEILGALKESRVTQLGRAIARFPVLPRYGKMLALSHQQNLLPYTICIVAALSVQEVLLETPIAQSPMEAKTLRQKWVATRKQWAGVGNSLLLGDPMVLLRAVGAAEYANADGKLESFCTENGLRHKAVIEIRKLRIQLTNEIKLNVPDADIIVDPKLPPPTDLQAKLLRQIMLAGMADQVARKLDPDELAEGEDKAKFKYAYRANNMEDPVFLHQGSVLKKTLPEFCIFQEIYETNKMYMRGVTAIEPEWLAIYAPGACHFSEPLLEPEPRYDPSAGKLYCTVSATFGPQAWSLSNAEIEFPKSIDAYRWFARCFLEGKVCPKLKKYCVHLLNSPSMMIKTWAKLQSRTEVLLKAFVQKEILTRRRLEEVFRSEPKYLLQEYLRWLPESAHSEVTVSWPPVG
ncbi:hypothetical protein PPYR_03731 [Photinus pyralis]|uniref:RNA helicase n=1 Tax=Photinus pyralis TaxID=7054 RepID=A0A5N4A3P9_PHOPY|nr:probable ATP-dependent RNA helicase kurz [Photinus pyralis]KAB0791931.1 hypothetical protein PPYR_03731 [Photinus pyralis]